jgi:biotin synthase
MIAGRLTFSEAEQALMFLGGANSIFNGDKLLTTPNPEFGEDKVKHALEPNFLNIEHLP